MAVRTGLAGRDDGAVIAPVLTGDVAGGSPGLGLRLVRALPVVIGF
jgi:hypothetical protein